MTSRQSPSRNETMTIFMAKKVRKEPSRIHFIVQIREGYECIGDLKVCKLRYFALKL
jgi:hypothetical protein